METKSCINCNKEFTPWIKSPDSKIKQKFCGKKCRNKWHSKKNYHKNIKNNPVKRRLNKERSKQWHKENREYHNKIMREKYHEDKVETN